MAAVIRRIPIRHGKAIRLAGGKIDTLIVDTVGFNDKNWLPDGYPATEKLHVIERYRRTDLAHLVIDVTIDDPGTFVKPWGLHMTWELAPGEELIEYLCAENNQYRDHAVGK